MSDSPKAVFLSYAREDTDTARRIADALRGFGVEVWFDQNELRGGDSWDAKIRQQIRTCALFIPMISATTQARGEGYFRREWKIAVDRSHDMHEGVPFIMPVVVDDTTESAALVPDAFMRVQWTRLAGGRPTSQFVEQVKLLLEPRGVGMEPGQSLGAVGGAKAARPVQRDEDVASPTVARNRTAPGMPWFRFAVGALAVVVAVAIAYFIFRPRRSPQEIAALVAAAQAIGEQAAAKAPAESKPAPPPAPAPAAPAVNDKSLAVLPFENMSEEKDGSFFADGIHEDILTNLALVHELHVVSRTSVMQYRGTTKPIRQIGTELGVAYLLEGSVRRAGNKVRVTGQLINARTDEHVWAKAYDRDITDIFALQSELSQEIAGALAAALSPQEKSLLERRPTQNLAAYDAYVKARQMAQSASSQQLELATIESLLNKAVELDPNFAAAWSELGRHHAFAYFNETDRSADRLTKARAAIETAVRLAPDAPEVIENYGDYFYYGYRDYARAVEQYQRLAVLRPNDAAVFGSLGLIHRRQGRMPESLTDLRHAVELEPRNLRYVRALQQLVQALDRYEEAAALQQRVVDLSPGDVFEEFALISNSFFARGSMKETTDWLAQAKAAAGQEAVLAYGRKNWAVLTGNWAEAVRLDGVQRYYDIPGFPHWSQDLTMAFALAAQGDRAAARTRAAEAIPAIKAELEMKPSATAWSGLAGTYVLTGDREEALRCVRKAMELVPEASDAVAGPTFSISYGSTLAWLGDKDAALAELARLLRTPYGENIYAAKYGLNWFPLRGDPRFEALVNDPKNNAPLF
jgi:TolB-like protein/Tfp pilus assembly protein PilF